MPSSSRTGEARLSGAHPSYGQCQLCEHRCGVDRTKGEVGFCKATTTPRVFRHRVEYGEEAELIPSHLFYLSGCDLRCGFCVAGINAFDPSRGTELTAEFFDAAVEWGKSQGARNIQWVGGEPTIHLPAILDVMAACPSLPPVVWKSDFFGTPEAFELLDGAVDTYVADFKFGNDRCARRIAGVDGYVGVITRNLLHAARRGRLIVRHLLLPGHEYCCYRPILTWLGANMPDVPFSLRDSYVPAWRASRYAELDRVLTPAEGISAARSARHAGLTVIQ